MQTQDHQKQYLAKPPVSVLLTDGEYISALAALRDLGKAGYRVVVVSHKRFAHTFSSRYCAASYRVPDPGKDPKNYLSRLEEIYQQEGCTALVPVYLQTIQNLLAQESSPFCMLLPPADSFAIAQDKVQLCQWAKEHGFPVPRFVVWDGAGDAKKRCQEENLHPPLVVKAAIGEGSKEVRYAKSWEELSSHIEAMSTLAPLLVQELVTGTGYGVSCLFGRDKRLLASFVHKRLREIPPSGGASVLRESVHWDSLKSIGVSMLAELHWTGLAMVEFKMDNQGNPFLMEINPRFWGSLPLAVASGVRFPMLYVQEALDENPLAISNYPEGVRSQRLLMAGLAVLPHYLKMSANRWKTFLETVAFWRPDYYEDVFSLSDPMPALKRVVYTFWELGGAVWRKLHDKSV